MSTDPGSPKASEQSQNRGDPEHSASALEGAGAQGTAEGQRRTHTKGTQETQGQARSWEGWC